MRCLRLRLKGYGEVVRFAERARGQAVDAMPTSNGAGVGVNRRGTGVLVVCGLFALTASWVGESDRRESRAISAMRAIVSAESAYAAAHDGRFASLDCLVDAECTGSTAPLLSPDLTIPHEDGGYRVEFHPGAGPGADRRARAALTRFAVSAVPATREVTSHRSFCVDDRGVIYVSEPGSASRVDHGRCLDTHRRLKSR